MEEDLKHLLIDELAVRFGDLALAELEARDAYDIAAAKRHRSELETVEAELKSRGEESQAALIVTASLHEDKRVQDEAVAAVYRSIRAIM